MKLPNMQRSKLYRLECHWRTPLECLALGPSRKEVNRQQHSTSDDEEKTNRKVSQGIENLTYYMRVKRLPAEMLESVPHDYRGCTIHEGQNQEGCDLKTRHWVLL